MGTNYYIKENECEKCGRHEEIHLGKSSTGWQFSFQFNGGKFYKNVEEMKKWLQGKTIKNEYGEIVSEEDFWKMVDEKQIKGNLNHAEYMKKEYPCAEYGDQFIIDGYSFSDCTFS